MDSERMKQYLLSGADDEAYDTKRMTVGEAIGVLRERAQTLEAENARLRAALEWYADSANYVVWLNDQDAAVMIDGGERARKAKGGVE